MKVTCILWNNQNGWFWSIETRTWQLDSNRSPMSQSREDAMKDANRIGKRFGLVVRKFEDG